ncbi:hypothetical protein DSCW_57480 [Desulfosarcina widdelii]|uniref:Secondary thiamine-phosphate synthase enzyme n=1 Tax=Desulfosarcina widdelii TaxID=947919 RepID=A0A5K7ZEX3_9BACT|nr:hypothetical protein [Desulfosarcina widdelii]BBO78331.1 hypothetical protein DSCW_57480 [Desulfosarcina widdelii]
MHKARLSGIQFKKVPMKDQGTCLLHSGTWQQVVTINYSNRAHRRTIEVTLLGG